MELKAMTSSAWMNMAATSENPFNGIESSFDEVVVERSLQVNPFNGIERFAILYTPG